MKIYPIACGVSCTKILTACENRVCGVRFRLPRTSVRRRQSVARIFREQSAHRARTTASKSSIARTRLVILFLACMHMFLVALKRMGSSSSSFVSVWFQMGIVRVKLGHLDAKLYSVAGVLFDGRNNSQPRTRNITLGYTSLSFLLSFTSKTRN